MSKKKLFITSALVVALLLLGAGIYLKYVANFPIELRRFARIVKTIPRVYVDGNGRKVSFYSDGLKLAGTLYNSEREGKSPAIVLLHGSSPYGRKLALYRVLGHKFAELGYLTLSFDFRGYGESEDPSLNQQRLFDFRRDASDAIDFVLSLPNVDSSRVSLVGHSLGGSAAFVQATKDDRIRKVVSIGPSRRVKERVLPRIEESLRSGVRYVEAQDYRVARDMRLQGKISLQLIRDSIVSMLIDEHTHYYTNGKHKPLLLIDGELEDPWDRKFMKTFYEQLTVPVDYVTFKNVAHYHNTINWDGRSLIFYDSQAVDELVGTIDRWLKESY